MSKNIKHNTRESRYRLRLMYSIIFTEMLLLAFFYLSPDVFRKEKMNPDPESEQVEFRQVEITSHSDKPASPPKPTVPLRMPKEEILEDDIQIDPLQQWVEIPEESNGIGDGLTDGYETGEPVNNPDRPPQLFKIVEPEVPSEAKKEGIKAIIEVRFLINATGEVEEASIARIKIYDRKKEEYRLVDHIDFGLTKATLNAALQWKFKPAVKNGRKAPAYSIHSFTYGF